MIDLEITEKFKFVVIRIFYFGFLKVLIYA